MSERGIRFSTHIAGRSSPALAVGLFVVAGCSGTVPGAAARPATPAIASEAPPSNPAMAPPTASAPPRLAPSAAPPAASSPPTSPPLEEPLLPLTRQFVSVTLPGVAGSLIGVSGRGPRDLWFVTDEPDGNSSYASTQGKIIHYDGERVTAYGHPCFGYSFYSGLFLTRNEVLAEGNNSILRGAPTIVWASLTPQKKWDCNSTDYPPGAGLTVSSSGRVWQLRCNDGDCRIATPGGPSASTPSSVAPLADSGEPASLNVTTLWMAGLNDGWMTGKDEDGRSWLLRYNGVTWAPQASLDADVAVVDMWVDEEGHVWLTARRGGKDDGPATLLLIFDGRALHSLPVPASFATRMIRGTGAKDIWFLGADRNVYQWDGQRLRHGEAPFAVGDAWGSPGGEVWIVGQWEGGPGNGVAAHTAPSEVR